MKRFDVIVIGGGHAGTEAAAAAARTGARVALVTLTRATIGVMSCNPAIGGLGKGHLVREIDAMDGLMGRAADAAGIQFRLLNRRKGPAVQGPRAQADRYLYKRFIQEMLARQAGLTIIEDEVVDLQVQGGRAAGVALASGDEIGASAVVLTAGTFLNGVIHVGHDRREGGRVGDPASYRLAAKLRDLVPVQGRLKTGTPPRLDGRTIDWSRTESQPGDDDPTLFSFLSKNPKVRQLACGITHTNERTHDIVRANLGRSAMYGGHIAGVGPRYCPSIEDKVVRFSDKTAHQIFLEPEGLTDHTVYPNGISTSLPADVQIDYVRTVAGLENVEILQPGYAIEYDFFDPRALSPSLELRALPSLYLAGQVSGTTGYEEAAAQGLVAGLNAARMAFGRLPVPFTRSNSYIGVMVDDLTTQGVTEPYRMFTSRAEHRLALRADNADQRLTPLGIEVGCVGPERRVAFEKKRDQLTRGHDALVQQTFSPHELDAIGLIVSKDGVERTALDLLSLEDGIDTVIASINPVFAALPCEIRKQIACDALYRPYIRRQDDEVAKAAKDEAIMIPEDLVYRGMPGLSSELQAKLDHVRPTTLGQAGRIEGMTPAALTLILLRAQRDRRVVGA